METEYKLYGAILGDLAGQPFEFRYKGDYSDVQIHHPDAHFTDDTLMTLASARSILKDIPIELAYKEMGARYEGDYYGKGFREWLQTPMGTKNNSYGNGCLMRISPYMYIKDSLPQIMDSVLCSHRHEISISAVIKLYRFYKEGKIEEGFSDLTNEKKFKVEADATIDFCMRFFDDYRMSTQDRILKIISRGGDTDTNASIIGEMSNYWENDITKEDAEYVESKLDGYLLSILKEFNEKIK